MSTVPPQWTVEPVDTNVAAGQDATLHCQASGYPTPIITWKKAIGKGRCLKSLCYWSGKAYATVV